MALREYQRSAEEDAGIYQSEAACFYPEDANGYAYEWGDGSPHWATASEGHRMMREIRLDRPDAQIKLARESEPCWHLVCSGCGYRYDEDEWLSHFPSRSDAVDAADGSDWTVVDGAAYCWDCPTPPASGEVESR